MSTLSEFRREKGFAFDDRAVQTRAREMRSANDWAALVVDWYAARKKKIKPATFSFAMFDGSKIHGYWETPGVEMLLSLLNELGKFATKSGSAEFDLGEDSSAAEQFRFIVDHKAKTIRVERPQAPANPFARSEHAPSPHPVAANEPRPRLSEAGWADYVAKGEAAWASYKAKEAARKAKGKTRTSAPSAPTARKAKTRSARMTKKTK